MDDNTRESLVGWGQAFARWQTFKANLDNPGDAMGAMARDAFYQSLIEQEHTHFQVTNNTGDARLARITSQLTYWRTYGMTLAFWFVPIIVFVGIVALSMATGFTDSWFYANGFIVPVAIVVVVVWALVGRKLSHTNYRSQYSRAQGNLPSAWELNRAGYWQVEPDTWFNPIVDRVLYGHAYDPREADTQRAACRNETRQINALYRQIKRNSRLSPPSGTHPSGTDLDRRPR